MDTPEHRPQVENQRIKIDPAQREELYRNFPRMKQDDSPKDGTASPFLPKVTMYDSTDARSVGSAAKQNPQADGTAPDARPDKPNPLKDGTGSDGKPGQGDGRSEPRPGASDFDKITNKPRAYNTANEALADGTAQNSYLFRKAQAEAGQNPYNHPDIKLL